MTTKKNTNKYLLLQSLNELYLKYNDRDCKIQNSYLIRKMIDETKYNRDEKFSNGRYHNPVSFMESLIHTIQEETQLNIFNFTIEKHLRCNFCHEHSVIKTKNNKYGVLQRFYEEEILKLEEIFIREDVCQKRCNRCKKNVGHQTENHFYIPEECKLMVIEIALFDRNEKKFKTKININTERFSTSHITDNKEQSLQFRLKCAIQYDKNRQHYTIFVRNIKGDKWLYVDSLDPYKVVIRAINPGLENITAIVFEKI